MNPNQNQFMGGKLQVLDDNIIRRSIGARQAGLKENDINQMISNDVETAALKRQIIGLQQAAQQSQAPQEEKRNGWLDFLLPTAGGVGGTAGGAAAGAAVGSIVPGLGTAIGGGIGALLGGALGSGGAQVVNNKIQGKNFKDRLGSETLFGALGGAGKALKVVRGGGAVAKAVAGGASASDDVARAAKGAAGGGDDIARALGLVDNADDATKSVGRLNLDDLGRVSKTGKKLRLNARGFNTTQGKNAFGDASSRFGASQVLDDAGLKGSAANQFEQIDSVIKSYGKEADQILKGVTETANIPSLKKNIINKTALSPNAGNAAYQSARDSAIGIIDKVAKKNGGKLTARQVNSVKGKLGDQLSRAFKKLGKDGVLTQREEAFMDVWSSLDDEIIRLAPSAKTATKTQSILMRSIPALDAAQSKGMGVPFTSGLNLTSPTRLLSSLQDFGGRAVGKATGTGAATAGASKIPDILKTVAAQGGGRALFGQYATQPDMQPDGGLGSLFVSPEDSDAISQINQAGITDPNEVLSLLQANGLGGEMTAEDVASITGGFSPELQQQFSQNGMIDPEAGALSPSGFSQGMNQAGLDQETFNQVVPKEAIMEAIMKDFQATGGANMDRILQFADYANGTGDYAPEDDTEGGLDLNNTAITAISDLQNGLSQLDSLSNTVEDSNANNPIIGRLKGLNPFDTDAQKFDSELRLTRQIIGKALEGGVLRKEDEAKYSAILPNRGDTDAAAIAKIDFIKRDIQSKLDIYTRNQSKFNNGGGGLEDLQGLSALGL